MMTLEELITLYILQKNTHKFPDDAYHTEAYNGTFDSLTAPFRFNAEELTAPAIFKDQPFIPFVLFYSQNCSPDQPRPLIVHVHGGPNMYMSKDNRHAEIAYFISRGYVVVCPNYRGSTGYPIAGSEQVEWEKWVQTSKDKHHIYGPEDVFAVTKFVSKFAFVDKEKIYLRGGSFGSFINSHLLSDVARGKFEPIFKGAHFSGGVNYPTAVELPDNVPLLITHSKRDPIAPYENAELFMQHLLMLKLNHELDGEVGRVIQTFVSQSGDHHLIDPNLELDHTDSQSYGELKRYLQLTTSFIDDLVKNNLFDTDEAYDQFKRLMPPDPDHQYDRSEEILRSVHLHRIVNAKPQSLPSVTVNPVHTEVCSETAQFYGPTIALLKLSLGDAFTGNIRKDLLSYLTHHFTPINWSTQREVISDAGQNILANEEFFTQLVEMVENEESFLKENPSHMVMYHAAERNVVQLYCFINLWKAMLADLPTDPVTMLRELRLFEFMKDTFDDIEVFLIKMRKAHNPQSTIFNNLPGFAERAIACNPALISNSHSTASSSLWWYFKAGTSDRSPDEVIISSMLKILGLDTPARKARYLKLFDQEFQRFAYQPQALMQQIFVPIDLAEKAAYMCQLWGEEFKPSNLKLNKPSLVVSLIADPVGFETKLRENAQAFTNYGNCPGFGDTDKGFNYANTLQLRYLPRTDARIVSRSYYRSLAIHQSLMIKLTALIKEDLVEYLANDLEVPDIIVPGALQSKRAIYESHDRVRLFKRSSKINVEALYLQQLELYKNLIQNPRPSVYGGIMALDKASKKMIQERLWSSVKTPPDRFYLYSLCQHVKGYTYYDLLIEAMDALKPSEKPYIDYYNDNMTYLKEKIDLFCIPAATDNVYISGNDYQRMRNLLSQLEQHSYNPEIHELRQPQDGVYYETYLWGYELHYATLTVLNYARLAKENGYGHDISSQQKCLY